MKTIASTLLTLLLTALLAPPGVAQEAEVYERQYAHRFLNHSEVGMLVQNLCLPARDVPCQVRSTGRNIIAVVTVAEVHERITAALAERDRPPRTQAFNLVLLRADRGAGGTDAAALPEAARQALDDLRSFLPFTRYTLLDSAFFRTTRDGRVAVSGSAGTSYFAELSFASDGGDQLYIAEFELQELVVGPTTANRAVPAPPVPDDRGTSEVPAPEPSGWRTIPVLETTFSMTVGETVVVGTSKLDGGDEALVVLLTAVP